MKKYRILVASALGLIGAVLAGSAYLDDSERLTYTEEPVTRGDVESVVITSGTLEAMKTVIVGSQLSGQIAAIYADFNQPVRQGELIARIDPRTFEARVAQNRAEVRVAETTIAQRKAEVGRARTNLAQAERELARRQSLRDKGHLSAAELDIDLTSVAVNRADVEIADAALASAEAALAQRRSALQQSELDLERTEIRAPIAGTVVNRTVQEGQTVAASLQAPELFQIAEDLQHMKVEASVDEADIGRIREGMPCRFTVDAYPERSFQGQVTQVRIAPDRLLNVVTYRVIIATDNEDRALLPGMTANVEVILGRRTDVLRVPGAALRFSPNEQRAGRAVDPAPAGGQPPGPAGSGNPAAADARRGRVWVLDGDQPTERKVVIGLADDHLAEIVDGLVEGERVIVRASRTAER